MNSDPNKSLKKKKRAQTLPEVTLAVVRATLVSTEARLDIKERLLARVENVHAKVLRAQVAAEADAEALMNAVRVLADQVSSTTHAGRTARTDARQFLEERKIQPPHTLGFSRPKRKKGS